MSLQTIGDWLDANQPNYNRSITTFYDSTEELFDCYPFITTPFLADAYKRYGVAPSVYFANKFAREIGAPEGFEGRFFNCGMGAIRTAFDVAELSPDDHIIASNVIYSEGEKILSSLEDRFGFEVTRIKSADDCSVLAALREHTRIIFAETVGNGLAMPVCSVPEILDSLWTVPGVIFILDNTFLTPQLFNPFEVYKEIEQRKGQPSLLTFVYVESLSKWYRAGEKDEITAGLIIAIEDFIEKCDDATSANGTYLPMPSLEKMPVDMLKAAEMVLPASSKAKFLANWLRQRPEMEMVMYPEVPFSVNRLAGALIYALLSGDQERMVKFVNALDCPKSGSS